MTIKIGMSFCAHTYLFLLLLLFLLEKQYKSTYEFVHSFNTQVIIVHSAKTIFQTIIVTYDFESFYFRIVSVRHRYFLFKLLFHFPFLLFYSINHIYNNARNNFNILIISIIFIYFLLLTCVVYAQAVNASVC